MIKPDLMFTQNVNAGTLQEMVTNEGAKLLHLTFQQPVMLIFLRHFGCTFCREALDDISRKRDEIENMGTKLVMVHMTDFKTAEHYFNRFNIRDAVHISDPTCRFYTAFGLTKGTTTQLFGLQTWIKGFNSSVLKGRGVGLPVGDGFQMPGVFVLQDGEVKEEFIHKVVSDRPDYVGLVKNCCELTP